MSVPSSLQAIAKRIEQADVNSELYTRTTTGTLIGLVTEKSEPREKGRSHRTRTALHAIERGEVSVFASEGKLVEGTRAIAILAGPSLYLHLPGSSKRQQGRPWVRFKATKVGGVAALFPFHGDFPMELSSGAGGSYAGLVNLLTTAEGEPTLLPPATVGGRMTTGFSVRVDSLKLIKGLTPQELSSARKAVAMQTLEVFVDEHGVPLRVVQIEQLAGGSLLSVATEVQAINVPVSVKPPARRRTIGEKQFRQLSAESQASCSSNHSATASASIEGAVTIETC